MRGEFKVDVISAAQREFEGQIKLINATVSAYGIASKNKRMGILERLNLMDETTAIDLTLGDPEVDRVKCPEQNGELILRADCLDYSGEHMDDCSGCAIGIDTKRKLLPL